MTIEVLVQGAGAIGGFYGSRLAVLADVHVSCVCRSNFPAVHANGFHVTSPQFGASKWTPTRTFANASEARQAQVQWDYIVVATKALPDVGDDSVLLDGLVSKDTVILLIQNGLGVEEPYHRRFPDAVILSAVTITSAAQPRQGHIQHNRFTRINSGPYPRDSDRAQLRNEQFHALLARAGIPDAAPYSAQTLQLLRWHKIGINGAMSPSSVLAGGTPVAVMANSPELYEHLRSVMQEVFDAGQQVIGQPFPKDFADADQILKSSRNSPGVPSMLTDWEQGKKMELEVILGNPIRQAEAHGIAMPRMKTMYALLKHAQAARDKCPPVKM